MKGAGLRPLRLAVGEWSPGREFAGDPLHAIAAGWAAIVGPDVAAQCAPLEISGKTLVIATKSSAWSQQLSFLGETILAGVRDRASGAGVERLAFRAGALRAAHVRPPRAGTAGGTPARRLRRAPAPAPEPAVDLQHAFERLRDRMRSVRATASMGCERCGAPLEATGDALRCAPCAGRTDEEAALALERLMYMAPWLTLAELREHVPAISGREFEHARRRLLQRWWLLLERARRAGRVSPSGIERQIASSYVLLQSRLPPDRLSPAVVRNILGEELDALLWPRGPGPSGVGHRDAFVE